MRLTENRRIALNVIVTYGRTVIDVLCSLFAVRWVLMALGQRDFGLYGVVGGLVVFVTFINGLFSSAVARFYGYEIGKISVSDDKAFALEECRRWFSTAIVIHIVIPLVLFAIGYTSGDYAIKYAWIGVPTDRIDACRWVWLFTCVDSFTAMLSAPIFAMFTAKQNIAEMTIYSVLQTIGKTVFIYTMTLFQRDWLVLYSIGLCIIAQIPRICAVIHALCCFDECKFRCSALRDVWRYKKLISFVGWRSFMGLGDIAKGQGISILVTRSFGPIANAAMTVGTRLGGESAVLSSALQNAFAPAITAACGADNFEKMRLLAYRVCKYSTLLVMLVAIPLALEVEEVLRLWLVTPPVCSEGICICIIAACVVGRCSFGHTIAVMAKGKISAYCLVHGIALMLSVLFAWIFVWLGGGIHWVGIAIVVSAVLALLGDILIARRCVEMSIFQWLKSVMLPLLLVSTFTIIAGLPSINYLPPSCLRVCITTVCCVSVFIPAALFTLETSERNKIYKVAVRCIYSVTGR